MSKNEIMEAKTSELAMANDNFYSEMLEELDGLGPLQLDTVKVPSGGGIMWEVPGEDPNNPEPVKELVGVIVARNATNGYWPQAFGAETNRPDCFSNDGKVGVDNMTGECRDCATCPRNQFGSNGKKACKNMMNLYLASADGMLPLQVVLPPTSIRAYKDYVKRLLSRRLTPGRVLTGMTLTKAKSKDNIQYSTVQFVCKGVLRPEDLSQYESQAQMAKASIEAMKTSAAPPTGNYEEISDEPLPFE